MKKLNFIILALVIIAAVTGWQYTVLRTKNQIPTKNKQDYIQEEQNTTPDPLEQNMAIAAPTAFINFMFDFGPQGQISTQYQISENNTKNLFTITDEIAKQNNWDFKYTDYVEMGYLVTQIGAAKNGQDNKYWQYFVNGEQPQISANKYIPKSGEKIEWRFAESKF